jgi:uncharacterized protein
MPEPDYAGAVTFALTRLHAELSPELTYHSAWHTEHDVLPAALRLALLSGIPEEEQRLLQVAAAFHDIGFTQTRTEHERVGAGIAAQILPQYGLDADQIARIVAMIMATKLPQSPRTLIEEIIADADLDVLGREDFLLRNRALRDELAAQGSVVSDEQWVVSQISFLEQHRYFTPAARTLRSARKQAHLEHFIAQHNQNR